MKRTTKIEKKVLIVETILILGIFVYLFISTSPTQISPASGKVISDPDFVFEISNGEQVLVSIDEDFSNPIVLEPGSDVVLPPGTYYWKVKSILRESKVSTFTIQSHTALDLKPRGEKYELENSGNVDLEVEKSKAGLTTGITLDIGETIEVEQDNSEYEGGQE